mgnify:CR=1 FL=1
MRNLYLSPCLEVEEGSDRACVATTPWISVNIDHVFADSCGLQARLARFQNWDGIGLVGYPDDDHLFVELQDQAGFIECDLTVEWTPGKRLTVDSLEELVRDDYECRYGLLDETLEDFDHPTPRHPARS